LLADHDSALERALWSAVRTFDERAAFLRRLKERKVRRVLRGPSLQSRARQQEKNAAVIRKLLQTGR